MLDGRIRSNIKKGLKVKVEAKQDVATGKLTEGTVKEVLTPGRSHPYGIMVDLENGVRGRVKEIANARGEFDKIYSTEVDTKNNFQLQMLNGEDLHNEFKSTFRFDLKRFEKGDGIETQDKKIEKEVSVAIAALANKEGGRLFLGIRDDGEILGLQNDFKLLHNPSTDKFLRILWQSIENYVKNKTFVSKLKISSPIINDKMICMIEVPYANEPIFVNDKNNEESYVRIGSRSEKFTQSDFLKYCNTRFRRRFLDV